MNYDSIQAALAQAASGRDGALVLIDRADGDNTAALRLVGLPNEQLADLLKDLRASRADAAGWQFLDEEGGLELQSFFAANEMPVAVSSMVVDADDIVTRLCEEVVAA